MALTVTPVRGTPILASWGTEIRDRTNQLFANYTDLTNQWSGAPEGSQAITLDTYRLWIKRGGLWQAPLTLPLGAYYRNGYPNPISYTAPGSAVPGINDWALWMDQYALLARRLYLVLFQARVEAQALAPITFGGVVNVYTGTNQDYQLLYNGGHPQFATGQEALVFGWPMERVGAAYRAGSAGYFLTGGNPGQQISVAFQHVLIQSPANSRTVISNRTIIVIDQGPA